MGLVGPRRPIKIANASGARVDPGEFMLWQAENGSIDAITGDYLAEINLAANAEKYLAGTHPGYEETALEGISLTLDLIAEHKIKVVLNGGALNPKGLAEEVQRLVYDPKPPLPNMSWTDLCFKIEAKGYDLIVAYVYGDDLTSSISTILDSQKRIPPHLDEANTNVRLAKNTDNFYGRPNKPIVSAHAYLGARAITLGLEEGADLIFCGRVSDASPVIGLSRWWHGWNETDFDQLAGSLVAGHLIECSAYATGANFSGFENYSNAELINLALPIAEVHHNGDCTITKHEAMNGFVTEDTIRSQLLYEIQGELYINSDVCADLADVSVENAGKNRVFVSGVKGLPPPPTTKLAIFYKCGYQCELALNATGTRASVKRKYEIVQLQIMDRLTKLGKLSQFDVLEFQHIGVVEENPLSQLSGTSQLRIFAQAEEQPTLYALLKCLMYHGMQHFSGCHGSMDYRAALPMPYLAYYPGMISQSDLNEGVAIFDTKTTTSGRQWRKLGSGFPKNTKTIGLRATYEPTSPVKLNTFGESRAVPLGEIAQGRSGDKGGNVNIGLFVQTDEQYDWLRSLFTSAKMKELLGTDWKADYFIERVEFANIKAVHFVIYGLLSRGISSSPLLDGLGKGFADYIRAKHVNVPVKFLK